MKVTGLRVELSASVAAAFICLSGRVGASVVSLCLSKVDSAWRNVSWNYISCASCSMSNPVFEHCNLVKHKCTHPLMQTPSTERGRLTARFPAWLQKKKSSSGWISQFSSADVLQGLLIFTIALTAVVLTGPWFSDKRGVVGCCCLYEESSFHQRVKWLSGLSKRSILVQRCSSEIELMSLKLTIIRLSKFEHFWKECMSLAAFA